ncbi:hypothetical protein BYZ73_01350 [Rhodovulum viride]|uniref:LysR substrate-binding domain-containing protein n=1 Tax=Rhodovulum viride TaxID=1231134 RepID=A0ABX9DNR3_9RHOB|nr:hypothetical protein BYZ73_01350 [Rhodovulum viride]
MPLFNRSTRRLEITPAGEMLRGRSSDALRVPSHAVESVQDLGRTPSGTVRITAARFAHWCGLRRPVLARFAARHPQIRLEISDDHGTVDILRQGFDIGIRFGDRLEEDLPAHRRLPLMQERDGEDPTIDMPARLATNDIEVTADAVRQGLGIGRLFEPVRARLPDAADFAPVLEPCCRRYPALFLYFPRNGRKAARVRTLTDFLAESAGGRRALSPPRTRPPRPPLTTPDPPGGALREGPPAARVRRQGLGGRGPVRRRTVAVSAPPAWVRRPGGVCARRCQGRRRQDRSARPMPAAEPGPGPPPRPGPRTGARRPRPPQSRTSSCDPG